MNRKIDDRAYANYLLQALNVNDLKQICRDFEIKGFSRLKKGELIDFILDSLAEEELTEFLNQKEVEIISNAIELAIKKINGEDKESIGAIKIVNAERHEIELSFKGFSWEISSFLSITPENIDDPERDCDCRIGSNMGLCNHFWVGFILSLKENYFKLSEWTLTKLPADFEDKIKTIKLSVGVPGAEGKGESVSLIDESSDNAALIKHLNQSVTIYEGQITEIVERQSEYQDRITIYYHISLKGIRLGPKITRKSDFREEDIVNVEAIKIRISERLQDENELTEMDKIKVNGKLVKDSFWGIMVKNIRKVEKL